MKVRSVFVWFVFVFFRYLFTDLLMGGGIIHFCDSYNLDLATATAFITQSGIKMI